MHFVRFEQFSINQKKGTRNAAPGIFYVHQPIEEWLAMTKAYSAFRHMTF